MSIAIAIIILVGLLVCVRLFDASIRASKYGKQIVVYIFVIDVLYILARLIWYVIGGN